MTEAPDRSARRLGLALAAATLAVDQGFKHWMVYGFDIAARQPVAVGPYLDLVLLLNPGVSYSLFPARSAEGRLILLAVTGLATALLAAWLWRAGTRPLAAGLGLLVGGALGNGYDRLVHGAVLDFFHIHVGTFSWYVFNLADAAIVAGVALLIYDSVIAGRGARPQPS